MAVYKIVEIGDPILREKCRPVQKVSPSVLKLLDNLADTLREVEGAGLAAPQIGVPKRVFVVDVGDGLIELINPVLIWSDGHKIELEGCLSIPGVQKQVIRPLRAKMSGLNRFGEEIVVEGEGLLARALVHELDHLDGILFIDHINKELREQA